MTITLELPQELEAKLAAEAEELQLSLPEYILQLLWAHVRRLKSTPATDVLDAGDGPMIDT